MNPRHPQASRLLATLLTLAPCALAQSLSGRVVSPTGQPIAGIDVDAGGGTTAATTGATGQFTITGLQNDDYDIEYLPRIGAPWAARMITTIVNGATNVGDVVLQPGFVVSGTARNQAGTPLLSCNVNVYQNGQKLFTPHDGSDLAGNFSVTVPAGVSEIRVLPPVGAPLVPFLRENATVGGSAGNLALGVVTLRDGFAVTGAVVDSVSSVPIGQSRLRAFDSATGQRIVLVNDTVNTFGQFNILLPTGLTDLEISPPVGNTHVGRLLYGVVVVAPVALGNIGLKNGVLVSGVVSGPGGVIAGVDVDVLDAEGTKQFTANDSSGPTGAFSVAVPTGTGWRLRFEPPANLGIVGARTAPLTLSGNLALGTIALTAGVPVSGIVRGPTGPEADAHLVFVDRQGNEIVTVGDRSDGTGRYQTHVPAGDYTISVETVETSHAQRVLGRARITGATVRKFQLPSKVVRCELNALGTLTLAQGSQMPVDLVVQSLTGGIQPTTIEFVVVSPSGSVYPILPATPLDAPPTPLFANGVLLTLPILPTSELGKELHVEVSFRHPTTGALFDRARTKFVLQ